MGLLEDLNSLAGGFSATYFPTMRWNREQNRADELLKLQQGMKDLEMQKLGLDIQDRQDAKPYMGLLRNVMSQFNAGGGAQTGQTPQVAPQSGPDLTPSGPYTGKTVKDLPLSVMNYLDYWGRNFGVPEDKLPFLYGIAAAESGGDPWAHNKSNKNGTNDFGLMQINSGNLGMLQPGENIFDPSVNTRIGAQIFADNLKRSGGDTNAALGGYNTGQLNPNSPYVGRVLGAMGTKEPVMVAAAPTNTMSDASGPPPGITPTAGQAPQSPQAPAPGVTMPTGGQSGIIGANNPQFLNLLIAGAATGNKYIMDASKTLLSGMKQGIDVLNSRSPEYLASLDIMKNFQQTMQKSQIEEMFKNPQVANSAYRETANGLRKDFEANKDVQVMNVLGQSYANIQSALKTPGREGDVALIYALMKIFDPNSVVRESEYAMAAAGRDAASAAQGAFQRVVQGGGALLPEERENFRKVVENMIQAQQGRYDSKKDFYTSLSKRYGVDPGHVIVPSDPNNSYSTQQNTTPGTPNAPAPPEVAAEYDMSGKRLR